MFASKQTITPFPFDRPKSRMVRTGLSIATWASGGWWVVRDQTWRDFLRPWLPRLLAGFFLLSGLPSCLSCSCLRLCVESDRRSNASASTSVYLLAHWGFQLHWLARRDSLDRISSEQETLCICPPVFVTRGQCCLLKVRHLQWGCPCVLLLARDMMRVRPEVTVKPATSTFFSTRFVLFCKSKQYLTKCRCSCCWRNVLRKGDMIMSKGKLLQLWNTYLFQSFQCEWVIVNSTPRSISARI